MKKFSEVRFEYWYAVKMGIKAVNAQANGDYTYSVEKETDKAVQLRIVKRNDSIENSFTIWAPKSAIENLDDVLRKDETAEEKRERILTKAIKLKIELQNEILNGADKKSKEFVKKVNLMNKLIDEWVNSYILRYISQTGLNPSKRELIKQHKKELGEILLAKEKELKSK